MNVDEARARLGALNDFVVALSASRNPDDALRLIAFQSRQALQGASSSLSMWDRSSGVIRTLVNEGDLGSGEEAAPKDETYTVAEFERFGVKLTSGDGHVACLADPKSPPALIGLLTQLGKHSGISVPVVLNGRVWGELWVTRTATQPPYTEADLGFARLVASQAAAGIAQAEHVAQVERLAYTDELTGLANRRAFEDGLDRALSTHMSMDVNVGLIVMDVNGLKRLNDGRGHLAGDAAMIAFGAELSIAASEVSGVMAARLGGDEFCLLCLGASADEVLSLAEDVCRRASKVLPEGVACGVATTAELPTQTITATRLMRAADAAQYRAKRARSLLPVVAGRRFPSGPGHTGGVLPPDRRQVRGRGPWEPGALLDEMLVAIDQTSADSVLDRLGAVAAVVAKLVDATSWWISDLPEGTTLIRSRRYDAVSGRAPNQQADAELLTEYAIEDFPQSYAALAGQCVHISVDDFDADPAEIALMTQSLLREMLMAGGTDRDGTGWLIEIFGDQLTSPLVVYRGALRAATSLAIHL